VPTRILVVEDNRVSLDLVDYLLKSFGYETFTAPNGQEGIRIARQERPHLILCDLQMPVLDGYGFMRLITDDSVLQAIPVIAVTALSMPGDRENVMAVGFSGYLSKPIDPETFIQTVENFLPVERRKRRPV
jgi:two-component system cell cycle response regulator